MGQMARYLGFSGDDWRLEDDPAAAAAFRAAARGYREA
jgi:hypothetical protein